MTSDYNHYNYIHQSVNDTDYSESANYKQLVVTA